MPPAERNTPTLSHRLQHKYAARITGAIFLPGKEGIYTELPNDLPEASAKALKAGGIRQLYSHQAEAWRAIQNGEHVVVVTPTASGKSLCYTLPWVAGAMKKQSKALYLFPTMALAQD